MLELNISQSDLARTLEQQRGTINTNLRLWGNGKYPSIRILKKWAVALEIDYKDFFPFL